MYNIYIYIYIYILCMILYVCIYIYYMNSMYSQYPEDFPPFW